MFIERVAWEASVAFQDIDDHRAPGDDIALLRFFVEEGEGADYVGAETVFQVSTMSRMDGCGAYGISAPSVSSRLFLLSSPSS